MKVKSFDRSVCRVVGDDVLAALKKVAQDYGLEATLGRGVYRDKSFTLKVEFAVIGRDGIAETKEVAEWNQWTSGVRGNYNGIPKSALHGIIIVDGTQYRIDGLRVGRSRFPVIVTRMRDGKGFRLTCEAVRKGLGITKW